VRLILTEDTAVTTKHSNLPRGRKLPLNPSEVSMKRFSLALFFLGLLSFINPQHGETGTEAYGYGTWLRVIPSGTADIYGGQAANGSGNIVLFQLGQHETLIGNRAIYGGYVLGANASSKDNMVVMDRLCVTGEIVGGIAASSEGSATAQYNDVLLSNNSSAMSGIIGAEADLQGAGRAIASNSRIVLSGSSVQESAVDQKTAIFGGRASLYNYSSGVSYENNAYATSENNLIDVFDWSSIRGDVVGGYASLNQNEGENYSSAAYNTILIEKSSLTKEGTKIVGGQLAGETGRGTAQFNTINLSGVTLAAGTELYGGLVGEEWTSGVNQNLMVFYGNTLSFGRNNLPWNSDTKFKRIANFETFNFTIPSNIAKDAVVVQTENLVLGNGLGSPSYVNSIQYSGQTAPGLAEGDSITLIKSDNTVIDPLGRPVLGAGSEAFQSTDVTVKWGSLFEQEVTTAVTTNALVAQVKEKRAETEPVASISAQFMSNSVAAPSMIYQADPVFVPTVANIETVQGNAKDYVVPSVKLAADSEKTHTMGARGHARNGWASLSTEEKQARREARQARWASMSDEQKAERRVARQARPDGAIIEHGHRHK
jgi:hypothetical protein